MNENIIEIKVKQGEIETRPLVQWDFGQALRFVDNSLDGNEVDFSTSAHTDAAKVIIADNIAAIPDYLLEDGREIKAYLEIKGEDDRTTVMIIHIPVIPRTKPNDYVPTKEQASFIRQLIDTFTQFTGKNIASVDIDETGLLTITLVDGETVTYQIPEGPQGPEGPEGPKGDTGDEGPQGLPGADGKSAYQAAVEGGYTGTEDVFNAFLASAQNQINEADNKAVQAFTEASLKIPIYQDAAEQGDMLVVDEDNLAKATSLYRHDLSVTIVSADKSTCAKIYATYYNFSAGRDFGNRADWQFSELQQMMIQHLIAPTESGEVPLSTSCTGVYFGADSVPHIVTRCCAYNDVIEVTLAEGTRNPVTGDYSITEPIITASTLGFAVSTERTKKVR